MCTDDRFDAFEGYGEYDDMILEELCEALAQEEEEEDRKWADYFDDDDDMDEDYDWQEEEEDDLLFLDANKPLSHADLRHVRNTANSKANLSRIKHRRLLRCDRCNQPKTNYFRATAICTCGGTFK